MITLKLLRRVFQDKVPAGRWIPRWELRAIVSQHRQFDTEDLQIHQANELKWHHQIDCALNFWKKKGNVRFSHAHTAPAYYFEPTANWSVNHKRTPQEIIRDELAALPLAERKAAVEKLLADTYSEDDE